MPSSSYQDHFLYSNGNLSVKSPQERLNEFREKYPPKELYRLMVDGYQYSKPNPFDSPILRCKQHLWTQYERREPNSLNALFQALDFSLQDIENQTLTVEYIQQLHSICTTNVSGDINYTLSHSKLGHFRSSSAEIPFQIPLRLRGSKEGVLSLISYIRNNPSYIAMMENGVETLKIDATNIEQIKSERHFSTDDELASFIYEHCDLLKYKPPTSNDEKYIEKCLTAITSNYNSAIQKATSLEERLKIIGETIEKYERLHPFEDANGRVFVNILLNRLLIQNGFPPVTLFDPNVFDALSHPVAVLTKGIENTQIVYAGKPLFGIDTSKESSFSEQVEFNSKLGKFADKDLIEKAEEIKDKIYVLNKLLRGFFPTTPFVIEYDPEAEVYSLIDYDIHLSKDMVQLLPSKANLASLNFFNAAMEDTQWLKRLEPFGDVVDQVTKKIEATKSESFDQTLTRLKKQNRAPNHLDLLLTKLEQEKDKLQLLQTLIDSMGDIDSRDRNGNSLLHLAFLHKYVSIAEALIANHALLAIRNRFNTTPIQIAIEQKLERLIGIMCPPVVKIETRVLKELEKLRDKVAWELDSWGMFFMRCVKLHNSEVEFSEFLFLCLDKETIIKDIQPLIKALKLHLTSGIAEHSQIRIKGANGIIQENTVREGVIELLTLFEIIDNIINDATTDNLTLSQLQFLATNNNYEVNRIAASLQVNIQNSYRLIVEPPTPSINP